MSLKKQMILYFSCLMVIIFTLTEMVNAFQSYKLLERNITASVTESLNLGLKNLDYYFQDAGNVCSSIMADERAQKILDQETENFNRISDRVNRAMKVLRELSAAGEDIRQGEKLLVAFGNHSQ